ncbi:GIY-YIG nuclease family protein [Salaquimonas pukyongi]|uniref:GIY-YIG nuclease family protein n=1 Tax=Salaquimonas pukyongi TaxID=2712698 RepID=UPI0012EC9069|nr:GIY-YIG nuclease family protein [Salaquimonas pukyongi]
MSGNYEVIPALDVAEKTVSSAVHKLKLRHFEVETEGHWRKLKPDQRGKDQHGNTVTGKTWVLSSNKWRARPREDRAIYMKDPLALAKAKVEEVAAAAQRRSTKGSASKEDVDTNVVYLLRCHFMEHEVYKVGWTTKTAEERAQELSRETGVPSAFVVVKYWQHQNARELEKEVHMMLSPYRINERREFFKVDADIIIRIIEETLVRVAK